MIIAFGISTALNEEPAVTIIGLHLGSSFIVNVVCMSMYSIGQMIMLSSKGADFQFLWPNESCMEQSWARKWWRCVFDESTRARKHLASSVKRQKFNMSTALGGWLSVFLVCNSQSPLLYAEVLRCWFVCNWMPQNARIQNDSWA